MSRNSACCEPAAIAGFLRGDLSAERESTFVEHLDSCEFCRQALEDSVGGPGWQQEVQLSLVTDETDLPIESQAQTRFEPLRQDAAHAQQALAEQALAALRTCMAPTDDPAMMGRVGAYEIAGIIGRGAAGIVVKAFQPALNRFVAVKLLAPELAVNAAARVRFEREAQAAAAVVHEHVVPIYAVDEFRGTPFLVMQYVSGGSLEKRLAEEGILTPAGALRIGLQIASGLTAAHAQGLIHRDIKPANILLESGLDRVLITDFGLARAVDDATLTHSGFAAGTPQFMSPEQARGDSIDQRSDLFSLGSVLYTLLSGRPPFRAETAYGLLKRICETPHRRLIEVNPDVPPWLSTVVDRLLAKDASDRFSDASEVASVLGACLAHLQNPTACELPREVQRWTRSQKTGKTWPRRRIVIGIGLLAGVIAAVYAAWQPGVDQHLAHEKVLITVKSTASEPESQIKVSPPQAVTEVAQLEQSVNLDQSIRDVKRYLAEVEARWNSRVPPMPDAWERQWKEASDLARRISQTEQLDRAVEAAAPR